MGDNEERTKDLIFSARRATCEVGFERDEGKVSIHRGIEGQGINTPFPFTLYYQGRGVLLLSRGENKFGTWAKV